MPTYMDLYDSAVGDTTTLSRTMVAVAKYSRYLLGQTPAPSAARLAWANAAIADTKNESAKLMWAVVGDPAYISAADAITDANLQAALEAAVNVIYP